MRAGAGELRAMATPEHRLSMIDLNRYGFNAEWKTRLPEPSELGPIRTALQEARPSLIEWISVAAAAARAFSCISAPKVVAQFRGSVPPDSRALELVVGSIVRHPRSSLLSLVFDNRSRIAVIFDGQGQFIACNIGPHGRQLW